MLPSSETKRIIRITVFIIFCTIILTLTLHLITGSEVFNSVYTIFAAILSIVVVPPFAQYLQQAFDFQDDVEEIVRKQMKTVWIEGFLQAEERAIISSSSVDAVLAEELRCQIPVHYKGYSNPTLNLLLTEENSESEFAFERKTNVFDDDQDAYHKIKITDDESLITIFNQFTQLVRKDDNVTGEFIVLLGNRGTRKTLQLLRLAEYLVDRDKRVPIYLNLFSWVAGSKRFDLWLTEEIANQYEVLPHQAKQLIESKYLVLLLDGFEEVPYDRRLHLIQSLTDFLQSRINQSERKRLGAMQANGNNGNGTSPIDLRDAVVLASLYPVQWMKSNKDNGDKQDKKDLDYRTNSNYFLKESPYENFLDLHDHIQVLVHQLQKIEDRIQAKHKAPVVVLKVKETDRWDVQKYMRCHFNRKVIQTQLVYDDVPNLITLENRKGIYRREKLEARGRVLAQQEIKELKESELYNTLISVMQDSPFLLRVFISTYKCVPNADLERCKLRSRVMPSGDIGVLKEAVYHARKKFKDFHSHLLKFAKSINVHIPNSDEQTTIPELQKEIKKLWEAIYQQLFDDKDLSNPNFDTAQIDEVKLYLINKFQPSENCILDKDDNEDTEEKHLKDLQNIANCLRRLYQREVFNLEDSVRKVIIQQFIQDGLRDQPSNVGPLGDISRQQVLHWIAKGMSERKQRVLDRGDVVFYLEDVGQQYVFRSDDKEVSRTKRKEYHGFVAFTSVVIFFAIYGVYLLALTALTNTLQSDPFPQPIIITVAVLLLFFARSFGWHSNSTNDTDEEDRAQLSYPMRWYSDAGVRSGLFMGIIAALIFFGVSQVIYGDISREPLRFEAAIVGVFSFALFYLLGGLELGRRYAIVARPEDGRRFLLITTILASIAWLAFFFLFLFWPRTRFDLLTQAQVLDLLPLAALYSLATGLFFGVVSAFVFSHLYLRHLVLFQYLKRNNKLQISYQQVLKQNVDSGFLRQVGGGYIFRHRLIMDYFSDSDKGADHVSTS
ncbi:MAG: hypothetical protein Phog2KO_20860 [Phototrophicaceae bacterium]